MTQAPTPTADTVRRLVRSLLGGNTEPDVRPVAEGGEPDTWWVGTHHVLRLAPDRETAVRRRRELRLRELVRPYVPAALPASVAHGEWAPGLTYTLDAKVAGGSGEDTAFHAALGDLAGNTVLRDMLKGMRAMIQRGWVERTGAVRSRKVAYDDHVPIFEAVADGDAEAARAAMARHMDGASRRLMKALEQREG